MTTHQSHHIPWQLLEDCYELKGIVLKRGLGTKSPEYTELIEPYKKKIAHFISCFSATIKNFEETERKKYTQEHLNSIQQVYTSEECNLDDGLDRDHDMTNGPLQEFDHWEHIDWESHFEKRAEAQVIKILFNRNQIDRILALARRGVPLLNLSRMTYSNFFHYGIKRVLEDALSIYLALNLGAANGTLNKNIYAEDGSVQPTIAAIVAYNCLSPQDYNVQAYIYEPFFILSQAVNTEKGKLKDVKQCRDVCKIAFKLLYQYSMVASECGKPIDWENELKDCIKYALGVQHVFDDFQ